MSAPVEPVSPLAEGRWLWRRLFVFVTALGLHQLLARALEMAEAEVTRRIADGVMILLGLTLVLYLVAPTAQQLVALIAQLRLGGRP